MPKKADTHIQNTAPGPPMKMAPVTPAMLPVPTVPARAVVTAWKGDRLLPWSCTSFFRNREPTVFFIMYPNQRTWTQPVRNVRYTPVPTSRASMMGPHTKPLTALSKLNKPSIHSLLCGQTKKGPGRYPQPKEKAQPGGTQAPPF